MPGLNQILPITACWLAFAGSNTPAAEPLTAFLDQHCLECHDSDVQKGGLNLQTLGFDLANPDTMRHWVRVFDRVHEGEMPPKKSERPEAGAMKGFLAALQNDLTKADKAEIAANGRVHSRRLTRVEYEHTLHDLLGIDLPLTDLLPEDPSAFGFQTVAEAQQLSHYQLARYLDAADIALSTAFDRAEKEEKPFKRSFTPELLAKPTAGNYRGPELKDGLSISWPITLQFFGRLPATRVPKSGWYRITLKDVHAVNPPPSGSVWGTLRSGTTGSSAPMLYMIGLVEATAEPRDMVFDAWIQEDHNLELKPNDATLKRAPSGATGGNVSFKGRNLKRDGFAGIAHKGIEMERIYPVADRDSVRRSLFGEAALWQWKNKAAEGLTTLAAEFAERAFRRPVTEAQLAPYLEMGLAALKETGSLETALRTSYRAMLCSPRFLTLIETPGDLDDHAVAARLSYALWVSMPDEALLKQAGAGKLRDKKVLAAQVERMLKDPKAERFVRSFTDQWLKLSQIDFTAPDPRQFGDFDPIVQLSMVQETRAYVAELIRENLSVTNLVDSDFTFLNDRLARHYKVEAEVTPGNGLQKVSLKPDSLRGGLVTQGAILKVTADGTSTSPVVRGVFVNERLLGRHIPPPPPGIPAIEPDIRGAVSIRDQLDKHRTSESCQSCHIIIDPPGFALESFDPVGGWRERYGKSKSVAVDPSGATPDGAAFADIRSWKAIYTARTEQLASGFSAQFLTYATGATLRFSDRADVDQIVARSSATRHGVKTLILESVLSPVFLRK